MYYGHGKCQGILVKLKLIVRVMGRGRGLDLSQSTSYTSQLYTNSINNRFSAVSLVKNKSEYQFAVRIRVDV